MAEPLILERVSYSYPMPGDLERPALVDVSVTVDPGETICVAGANGSGKSTLAQVCSGLLAPGSGMLTYGDTRIKSGSGFLHLRKKVGMLFQSAEDQLFADTVERDISFGPRNHGVKGEELEARVSVAASLVDLDIDKLGSRSPFSLSGGEKRRVALAGVLAMEPEVLILDEPFIGLDHQGREALAESIDRYRREREVSIIIVTHDITNIWGLAERFAFLDGGRLTAVESKRELALSGMEKLASGILLPQWVVLARELLTMGINVDDPSDPRSLATAVVKRRGGLDGR